MGWSPLKKRVYFLLSLGFLALLNTLLQGYISFTLKVIIDSLLILVFSLFILYEVFKDFVTRRKVRKEDLEAKERGIYKEIAEKVLKIKKRWWSS